MNFILLYNMLVSFMYVQTLILSHSSQWTFVLLPYVNEHASKTNLLMIKVKNLNDISIFRFAKTQSKRTSWNT